MNEIGQLILKTITELFGDNYMDFLIYMSFLFVTIWLFREFKIKVDTEEKNKKEKLETILTVLIDLRFEVKDFCSNRDNLQIVKGKLAKAAPYLSYELCQDIYKFSEEISENEIIEFITKLSQEIDIYIREQTNEILQLNKLTIGGFISYYYKTMFRSIVLPISLTYFSMFFALLFLLIILIWFQTNTILQKYYLIQEIINTIIFISLLISVIDSAITKKLNLDKKAWTFIIILLISSIICSLFSSKYLLLSTLNFVIYILFILQAFLKKTSK